MDNELTEAQVKRLVQNAEVGRTIRAWCQHPGFAVYKRALEEILADKKNKWLTGTDEEAKLSRVQAQGVQKAMDVLTQFMLVGDSATQILTREQEDPLSK